MEDCVPDSLKTSVLEHIVQSRPKMALYTRSAQYDHTMESYTPSNEVSGDGYQPGGADLVGGVVLSTDAGFTLLFHSPVWQNATITARGAIIYLADDANRVVRMIDFGKDVTSTNGPFTVKLPGAPDGGVLSL